MEILNQHWMVKAALPEFQLNAPVGSDTVKSALPGNVAATERKPNPKITSQANNPANGRANIFWRRRWIVFIGEDISISFRHLFYIIAAHHAIRFSFSHKNDLRADACLLHFEGNAVIGIHTRLLAPTTTFNGKNRFRGAEFGVVF